MKREPDDVGVFGPAAPDAEHWVSEGVHWEGSCVGIPGIPRTNDPSKVTCSSCLYEFRNKTVEP